jgi:hypothetical protein
MPRRNTPTTEIRRTPPDAAVGPRGPDAGDRAKQDRLPLRCGRVGDPQHLTTTPQPPGDPLPAPFVRLALLTKPAGPSLAANGASVAFTDTIPEPGHVLYGLDLTFYRASGARAASTGAVPKPIHLGSLSRHVTAPGQTRVTIPIGSKGKRLLKRYKQARLVVRTYFVTAVEQMHIATSRALPVAGRGG